MKFETKPLTLSERTECNDAPKFEVSGGGKVFAVKQFSNNLVYLKYGLKAVDGQEIKNGKNGNFDEIVNDLSTTEIIEISDYIADETNVSKKKKSSPS